ncbi:hypothetical protein BDZ89DRAFT_1191097 [Hymenopellis radicata]|nr:hypothetical protein BDZ89DRAFT_1191097 [Hymenopellis radicata]
MEESDSLSEPSRSVSEDDTSEAVDEDTMDDDASDNMEKVAESVEASLLRVESGEDGRGVREVVMGSGSGGGGCGVDVSSSHIIQLFSSPSSYRIRLLLIAVHLGRHVMVVRRRRVVCCPLAGAYALYPHLYGDDLKSVSNNMDADLESSAGVVVADLKSSDGSRPQDLLLAQSQQQQAWHKAKARFKPDPHPTAV